MKINLACQEDRISTVRKGKGKRVRNFMRVMILIYVRCGDVCFTRFILSKLDFEMSLGDFLKS